jgi:GNAT superfamily N-acetyltransferase
MTQAPAGITLRAAGMADIPAIVAVQARSWQTAYRGMVDDAFLEAIPMQQWIESWRAHFFAGDTHCVVAEDGGRVVGFASVGRPDAGEEFGPSVAEVHTIYIDAAYYSTGLGRRLMGAALERLRADGYAEVILWVLEQNDRGRRFYEAGGWTPDGARAADCWGATSVPRVRYRLSLAS